MSWPLRVLVVTSEWASAARPQAVPFLVEQVEQLRKADVEVELFTFRGSKNPLRYAAAWFRLRHNHRLSHFDLVHAHFGQSGLVALPCPVPVVVTFHGSDLEGLEDDLGRQTARGMVLRRVSRMVARRADQCIVVSRSLRASLPAKVNAAVIPCGIDLRTMAPVEPEKARAELGLPRGQPLVLFVGSPAKPEKNLALAKKAVAALPPELHVRLIVLFGKPHEQVPLYMSACDVLLVTSHHEGSPTAVKEAIACGLPVVSVPVGDVAEQLEGLEGCEVVCRDVAALAAALRRVLRCRQRLESRASALRYSHEAVTGKLLELYEEVAQQRYRRLASESRPPDIRAKRLPKSRTY